MGKEEKTVARKSIVEREKAEDPRYHNTWKLLKNYRDVVWSMEVSVTQLKSQFQIEYGSSVEEYLDSIYLAGADLSGTEIEQHARSIERSNKMLKLVDNAVNVLRAHHKNGEIYYWVLYYTYLSPQELPSVADIIEQLAPHIRGISFRTYYRRRNEATEALSSVLWGYTTKKSMGILDEFFPEK